VNLQIAPINCVRLLHLLVGKKRCSALTVLFVFSTILAGCRGTDESNITDPQFPLTNDQNVFGAFLNPSPAVPAGGAAGEEIDNVLDFPEAYYNTIDPNNTRDTFFKWRVANGFLNSDGSDAACDPQSCSQAHVKFRDTKDLGYGRNMFMRWNTVTNDVAVYVENFQVDAVPGVPYGPLNLEALINSDRQWNFGVNAIEFSAYPGSGAGARKFAKFYNFAGDGKRANDTSGTQQHFVDLDNRGLKPMPGACIVCHGGRNETLVYKSMDGKLKLAPTLVDGIPGDLQAHLQTIEFDTLQFAASTPGFTSEDNAEGIQLINEAVLSTYLYRQEQFVGSGDWNADLAIETLRGRYAGDPSYAGNDYSNAFVPDGWVGEQNLYRTLMGPNCLVCHALRGTRANSSVAFPTLTDFKNYSESVDHLVFEQGKMPLSLLNYSDFWDDKEPASMATALGLENRVSENTAIRPQAPVAQITAAPVVTGISNNGEILDIPITGSGSAFARPGSHRWRVTPATASITAGSNGDAVLRATAASTYTLTLTVDGVHGGSHTSTQTVRVFSANSVRAPLPVADINFFGAGGINDLLNENCVVCHSPESNITSLPIHFTACSSDDFNGNEFLYRSVLARVNFDSPLDSQFLRKPSNGSTDPVERSTSVIDAYHAGGYVLEEDADFSKILSWILNGAPAGDVPPSSTIEPGTAPCTPTM